MRARLDIEYLREAQQRIDKVGERAKAPEPALRSHAMLAALRANERRLFASNKWTKNTRKWDARKRKRGLSPKRMQASGLLRLILEAGNTGSAVRFSAYNGTLIYGLYGGRTAVFYARILADRDRRRRPVRLDKVFRVRATEIVTRYVAEDVLA